MAVVSGTIGNDLDLRGTSESDLIYGLTGFDRLFGLAGDDELHGDQQDDTLDGGPGNDTLYGGSDNDRYVFTGSFGRDYIVDSSGNNVIFLVNLSEDDVTVREEFGDLFIFVNGTNDTVRSAFTSNIRIEYGGDGSPINRPTPGNDVLTGTAGDDIINALAGNDVVRGGAGNDGLGGQDGNDQLFGELGNDRLFGGPGNDTVDGGDGNDLVDGGPGRDARRGGAGSDTFAFNGADSTPNSRDTILDFARGDKIDVRVIDANTGVAGNQGFTFVGTARPDAPGEIGYSVSGNTTTVRGTWDRDLTPEFEVALNGRVALTAADFLL
jgi:Ca2+-binding RTX toxin-like protein